MRILRNKAKTATLALVLMLTIAALFVALPVVNAHDPPWSIKTFAYLTVAPSTVGVSQQVILYMSLSMHPPTAEGALGDRWHNFTVEVTKPDDTTQILGPFDSDPIGFAWTLYTPDQVGTYTFQFSFPGQTLAGENPAPPPWPGAPVTGEEFIGDWFEPSTSEVVSITVQQEPIEPYPDTPPPTDYWTRPIDAQHRDWWSFSGNWLAGYGHYDAGIIQNPNKIAPYTEGPETAHILWTKPIDMGGLVGGEFGAHSFHCGGAYEGKWTPPVIINGILYYNEYTSGTSWRPTYLPGVYAVDLRTGEELWYRDDIHIDFGQIYQYDSPNEHGAFAYVWAVTAEEYSDVTTWNAYNAFTGDWWYTIENAPPPSEIASKYGPDGEILTYQLDTENNRLLLWNSSKATNPEDEWYWRPYQVTVDGQKGYTWNVTIPSDIEGDINYVLDDRILGSSGLEVLDWTFIPTGNFTIWCLSLEKGQEGTLLWKQDYVAPEGLTLDMGAEMRSPASLEDGVFTIWSHQTMQWWGYRLDNGNLLWGPTESQAAWDRLVGTEGKIAYGKLFSCGYGGILYCYDIQTGNLDWTYVAEDPFYLEAKWGGNYMLSIGFFADGKVYLYSTEHSPDDPKERGSLLRCVDAENGDEVWTIPFYVPAWAENPAIADGIIACLNSYDNLIYTFGKGETATTVSGPKTVVPLGSSVLIEGTVTDQSPGAKGTPAIADEDMSEWMKYLYMQFPMPHDAEGVEVTLDAIDPTGAFIHIGRATSDMSGFYSYMWTPETEGKYTIIATFEGSKSYWSSYAETAIGVDPTPPDYPEAPTEGEVAEEVVNQLPEYSTMDLVLIVAVVVVAILVVYDIVTRKRT